MSKGFSRISLTTQEVFRSLLIEQDESEEAIASFCAKLKVHFEKLSWQEPCKSVNWKANIMTINGNPLIYYRFGHGKNTTLLLSGVHPDELTPVPMGFRFAEYLHNNPSAFDKEKQSIVIAPLVNPDGFLRQYPTRTNGSGVDVNRNFFTLDWYDRSINWWQRVKNRRSRYFPGYFPNSEVETVFQIQLIDEFSPDKILSIHAPLGFLDYDGPGDRKPRNLSFTEKKAKQLAHSISRKSHNYRVVDYSFYPGSLGNFAGNERDIPTITLELETTDPKKIDEYWKKFLPGLMQSVKYPFKKGEVEQGDKAPNFFSLYKQQQ